MPITPEVLDQILKDYEKPEDLLSENGLLQQLTKALVERALNGEMTHHLGYEKHSPAGNNSGNSRNGSTPKVIKGKRGQVEIEVPRDRNADFEPQLVKKNQTRFDGLDEKIISLYARGMTTREIQGHLEEIYGVDVSPSLISNVTDAVLDEVRAWQSRPLDAVYPILYLDALQVKVKSQGSVRNKAIYLAFGVGMNGLKEVLGIWASDNEGSKFWMQVITELKNRGVQDIFIACVDGLKGLPRSHRSHLPEHADSTVHRASCPALTLLRLAQRPQRNCYGFEVDLSSADARRSRLSVVKVRRQMDGGLSDGRQKLAAQLGASHSDVFFRTRDS